jgi:hypothetical protein
MTTSIPLFLSSNRVSSSTSEAAFSQQLKPPLSIPDGAKAVRCYVDSATIPYSFPNVSSTTSRVVVRIPLSTAPSTQSASVTLELPTGVYDLTEIAEQLNLAVNTWLHTNGYPVLTGSWQYYDFRSDAVATKADAANFCSLLPDFHANRVQLTLNYDHSAIDFDPTTGSDTTLDDLLGFTSLCERTVEAQVTIAFGGYTLPASFCTIDVGAGGSTPEWKNVTLTIPPGTYSKTTLCTAINSAFVTAVNALPQASKFNPTVPAATATGPLIASISLEASSEVTGQYRVDFAYANYGNPFSFTAGTAVFGSYDATGTQTNTPAELQQGIDLLGSWDYYQTQDNHTLATMWTGAQTTPFTAEKAATIDRVTEIGIACPGLAHGSYGSGGSSSGATLARFQVTGSPGTNMVYRPTTLLKIDASHLIGARLQDVNVALVDQHGVGLTSLLGEKYSVVLVVEYDM